MQTIRIHGTDKQLYKLIAPLVMDPEVLKFNNNYPFKTTSQFAWFVAVDRKEVVGFIPIEQRGNSAIINNYYFKKDGEKALSLLIENAIAAFKDKKTLYSVVQTQHQAMFQEHGFKVEKSWKLYVKMRRDE